MKLANKIHNEIQQMLEDYVEARKSRFRKPPKLIEYLETYTT